jgi:hypothetical protein
MGSMGQAPATKWRGGGPGPSRSPDSIKPVDEAGVEQAINRRYLKWADGRSSNPQAEAWCQAKRDDKEASYTASQRKSKHAAHQLCGIV